MVTDQRRDRLIDRNQSRSRNRTCFPRCKRDPPERTNSKRRSHAGSYWACLHCHRSSYVHRSEPKMSPFPDNQNQPDNHNQPDNQNQHMPLYIVLTDRHRPSSALTVHLSIFPPSIRYSDEIRRKIKVSRHQHSPTRPFQGRHFIQQSTSRQYTPMGQSPP